MARQIDTKIHAVCVPFPAQGHITPMFQLAKLLNTKGFYITFINTEYNHRRLLRSRGPNSLDGTQTFRFEKFPDGLPPSDADVTQDLPPLLDSLVNNCLDSFVQVLHKINNQSFGMPPITLIICDTAISFAIEASRSVGDLPVVFFWTASACSYLGYAQYNTLVEKGIVPFKDPSFITDGSLDKVIDWVPSMKNITLKHLPSFLRIMDKNDIIFQFVKNMIEWCSKSPIIFNSFDALEHEVLKDVSVMATTGPIYAFGPLHNQLSNLSQDNIDQLPSLGSNLWKIDDSSQYLPWLDSNKHNSVVYVSFGSITTITSEQMLEFAWGLANSKHPFLWIVRPDIITGGTSILPPEFLEDVKDRSLIISWCDQVKVLNHPSIGVFLTHCGWNSTLESITSGVPLICWPFFADQQTNCFYSCNKWGVGLEIDNNVKTYEVEKQIREVMEGGKGNAMKRKAMEWKKLAEDATNSGGSSCVDFETFYNYVLALASK